LAREGSHPRDPELVALARASGDRARQAAIFAAQAALSSVSVSEEVVQQALHALAQSDMPTASHFRAELERLVQALDDVYWNLSDANSSQERPEVQLAFSKARAVNSLASALGPGSVDAVLDAVYEAQAALPEGEVESFLKRVKSLLQA
jgi:hypothetical protein